MDDDDDQRQKQHTNPKMLGAIGMATGNADFQTEAWQHETASLEDCCRWPAHGLSKIRGGPDTVIPLISGRRLDTSGAFYGIGGPEISDQVIAAGCDEYIDAASDAYQSGPRPSAIRFANRWAIEKDGVCQAEIIHAANEELPFAPKHLFGDICSLFHADLGLAMWTRPNREGLKS